MRRGDLVTIALQGDFGKPRPALIVQSDHFDAHPTLMVLLVSSALVASPLLRVTVEPDELNGLRAPSQIMVDKAITVMRGKVGPAFGRLGQDRMLEVERCLALFLGIAR
jgi:mRNA interferase MazF